MFLVNVKEDVFAYFRNNHTRQGIPTSIVQASLPTLRTNSNWFHVESFQESYWIQHGIAKNGYQKKTYLNRTAQKQNDVGVGSGIYGPQLGSRPYMCLGK